MAVSDAILGLIVERPDRRGSLVRRYRSCFPNEELFRQLDELHPFERLADGERSEVGRRVVASASFVAADADAAMVSRVDAALVSLREQALIEPTAQRGALKVHGVHGRVYSATPAGVAHFAWWMGDASTLDPLGRELRRRVMFAQEHQLPRLRELTELQELLCLDRLEELRRSEERMTFARCSTLEELWEAMESFKEPMCLQRTVVWVREVRQVIDQTLAERSERAVESPRQSGTRGLG